MIVYADLSTSAEVNPPVINPPPHVDIPLRLMVRFQERFPNTSPHWVMQAPDRDLWILAAPNPRGRITLDVVELRARTCFTLHSAAYQRTVTHRPLPAWARTPAGVLMVLDSEGFPLGGLDVVIGGDEPRGPRYLFALGIVTGALVYTIHDRAFTSADLIELTDDARRAAGLEL